MCRDSEVRKELGLVKTRVAGGWGGVGGVSSSAKEELGLQMELKQRKPRK